MRVPFHEGRAKLPKRCAVDGAICFGLFLRVTICTDRYIPGRHPEKRQVASAAAARHRENAARRRAWRKSLEFAHPVPGVDAYTEDIRCGPRRILEGGGDFALLTRKWARGMDLA